jgi:cytochrome o ubiquinol oxidase operon protein cyoD
VSDTRTTFGEAPTARSYLIGLMLALVLTAIPFAAVYFHLLSGPAIYALIAVAAIAQVLVHFRYFLHLGFSATPRENLLTLALAAVLIVVLVGGCLWIMTDLNLRMGM